MDLQINIEGSSWRNRSPLLSHRHPLVSTSSRVHQSLLVPLRRLAPPTVCFAVSPSISKPLREDGHVGFQEEPTPLKPLPLKVEGVVDDPNLKNPLQRMERLGTGWIGVILELEGVCVDYEYGDVSARSWQQLAQEEGKSLPPLWAMKKSEGMKNEQVSSRNQSY